SLPHEHAHCCSVVVGRHDVGSAIAVDVRHRHCSGTASQWEVTLDGEGTFPVVQQHAHAAAFRVAIARNDVGLAITVDVRYRHHPEAKVHVDVLSGGEGAIAFPQQHAHAPSEVGSDDVRYAVAVEVRHSHRDGGAIHGEVTPGGEGAIPL